MGQHNRNHRRARGVAWRGGQRHRCSQHRPHCKTTACARAWARRWPLVDRFNEAVKIQSKCLRTSIATEDASSTIGNAALRIDAFSPICDKGTAGSYTYAYYENLKKDEFSWNGYPLNIAGGEILVVDILPGQAVTAVFAPLDPDGKKAQFAVGDGMVEQPPLVATSASICGCVDYKDLLPRSQCSDTVQLSVLHKDALDADSFDLDLIPGGNVFYSTAAAFDDAARPSKSHHVSEVPFESYACYNDSAVVASFEYHSPKESRQQADSVAACKSACNNDTVVGGVKVCHSYSYLGFLAGKECRLLRNPAIASVRRTSSGEACAASCNAEDECKAYAHVSATNECALYFTGGYGSSQELDSGPMQQRTITPVAFCVRRQRNLAVDQHVRIGLSAAWDKASISHFVPATSSKELSTVYFLRACSKLVLQCDGATCDSSDLMLALQSEITTVKAASMLKAGAAAEDEYYVNFGCVTSGAGDHKIYEDCLPPDPVVLADVKYGFYFQTDMSGRPGTFGVEQARGKMLFDWVDFSTCEQAFSITTKHEAADNTAAARTWTEPESDLPDYYVHGARTCGEPIAPEDHHDALQNEKGEKRELGLWQEHCVNAVAENGAASITYERQRAWRASWRCRPAHGQQPSASLPLAVLSVLLIRRRQNVTAGAGTRARSAAPRARCSGRRSSSAGPLPAARTPPSAASSSNGTSRGHPPSTATSPPTTTARSRSTSGTRGRSSTSCTATRRRGLSRTSR